MKSAANWLVGTCLALVAFSCNSNSETDRCNPAGKWWLVTPEGIPWDDLHIGTMDTMWMTKRPPQDEETRHLMWDFADSSYVTCTWADGNVGRDTVIKGDTAFGISSFAAAGGRYAYQVSEDSLRITVGSEVLLYEIIQCSDSSLTVLRISQ